MYSTTLGRFVSADPTSLDRYGYANGNPLTFIDPTGLTAMIACGTGNDCDHGNNIRGYKNLIVQEWIREGRFRGHQKSFLAGTIFEMFVAAMQQPGYNGFESASVFGIAFFDSSSPGAGGWADVIEDHMPWSGDLADKTRRFLDYEEAFFGQRGADLWVGYSWGGRVVYEALNSAPLRRLPIGAILIEPGLGGGRNLPSRVLHSTRVISWADYDFTPVPSVREGVRGAWAFGSDDCGGSQHCTHQRHQSFMVDLVRDVGPDRSSATQARISSLAAGHGVGASCRPDVGFVSCN